MIPRIQYSGTQGSFVARYVLPNKSKSSAAAERERDNPRSRLDFLRFEDTSKNQARVVGRHVYLFHQLESLLLGSFNDVRQVPNPPVRVPGFQASIETPRNGCGRGAIVKDRIGFPSTKAEVSASRRKK
jgi:hypothetical protein